MGARPHLFVVYRVLLFVYMSLRCVGPIRFSSMHSNRVSSLKKSTILS